MKRCPNCQTAYDDDKQTFCIVEGAQLVTVAPAELEPPPTMFAPSDTIVSNPALGKELRPETPSGNWSGESSWPPRSGAFSDASETRSRKAKPLWILGGAVVLLALGLVIGSVVANFVSDSKTSESKPAEAQSNATQSAAPHGDAAVLSELKELENQMTNASIKGDKETLGRILADDYTATGADGKFYNKMQTLYSTEPMPSVTSWSIDNARLLSRGETSATLSAVVTFRSGTTNMERQQITDTFVRRDGRWQLLASQSTLLK